MELLMHTTTKVVLFDFGNVLGRFSHQAACRHLAAYIEGGDPEILRQALCSGPLATARQTGGLSPTEFYQKLQEDFTLDSACDFDTFATLWGDIFTPAPVEVLKIVQTIPPGVLCGIASNTEELHWPYIAQLETVQSVTKRPTSRLYKSYEIGFEKPNPAFFQYILRDIGCASAEVLFIDDVPKNVLAFESVGGRAEVFNLETDDPSMLRRILDVHGVLSI